jgi:LacI family transcriptional regulator
MKIDVPGDISVIGVDNDTDLCENARPQLSSVLLDFEHAGYRALEVLDEIIRDRAYGPVRETYPALGLVRRGSTLAGIGVPPRILDALAFIRDKACEGISASDVASRFHGSRRLAEMEFRRATGRSILEEIMRVRFEKAELLLRNGSRRLGGIAHLCGWKTENALRAAFLKRYGMSMRSWRNAHPTTHPGNL